MHKIQIRVHKTAKADKQGSLWWSDWSVGRFLSTGWASVIAGAGWRMGAVQGEVATRRKTEGKSAWLLLRTSSYWEVRACAMIIIFFPCTFRTGWPSGLSGWKRRSSITTLLLSPHPTSDRHFVDLELTKWRPEVGWDDRRDHYI